MEAGARDGQARASVPQAGIETIMGHANIPELIHRWSCGFREQELTVEEIQERFAELDVSTTDVAQPVKRRVVEAQRELDSIRWGMCEAGQRAEIGRIFAELEQFLAERTEDPGE